MKTELDLSNILIQRNKLLNELLSLFFAKAKELIDKAKNFSTGNNNKNSTDIWFILTLLYIIKIF